MGGGGHVPTPPDFKAESKLKERRKFPPPYESGAFQAFAMNAYSAAPWSAQLLRTYTYMIGKPIWLQLTRWNHLGEMPVSISPFFIIRFQGFPWKNIHNELIIVGDEVVKILNCNKLGH
jgi:hypothetical protein